MDVTSEFKHDNSILELSKEELQSELLKFTSTCKDLQQTVENRNQEVHVLKRQVISLTALEQEYQQDIEHIISADSRKIKLLRDRIQELESIEKSSINNDEVEPLQDECLNLKKTITELQGKLNTTLPAIDRREFDALLEENEVLKSKYKYFVHTRHPSTLKELQEQKDLVKQLTEELEEIRNTYTSNSANSKAKLEDQEEQIALMRIELSNAQTAQQNTQAETHEARGNSMFSEVYDKSIALKKKNEDLVKAYQEARLERNKLRNESSALRKDNALMCARWKAQGIEARQNDAALINTYKYSYEKMEDLVKKYEEELAKERNVNYNMPDSNPSVYTNMIKSKNDQIASLYKEFSQANGSSIMHRVEMREISSKVRTYLAEATQYKCDIEVLQEQLKALQEPNTHTNQVDTNNSTGLSIEKQSGDGTINKYACECQLRKQMCNVATMTVIDKIRTREIPSKLLVQSLDEEHSLDDASIMKATCSQKIVGEVASFLDDNTKQDNVATSNIVSDCQRAVRKVQFAEDVSGSFVNEQRRRARPRGKPMDLSQMVVIKRQSPKKS